MTTEAELAAIERPTSVDIVTRVISPNVIASPVTGLRAAIVHLELFEAPAWGPSIPVRPLGSIVLGDLVTLAMGDAVLDVAVGRATLAFSASSFTVLPLEKVVAEIAPLLAHVRSGGLIQQSERLVYEGDELRLRATVERVKMVTSSGYRSGVQTRLVVRDDLAPVLLTHLT